MEDQQRVATLMNQILELDPTDKNFDMELNELKTQLAKVHPQVKPMPPEIASVLNQISNLDIACKDFQANLDHLKTSLNTVRPE